MESMATFRNRAGRFSELDVGTTANTAAEPTAAISLALSWSGQDSPGSTETGARN